MRPYSAFGRENTARCCPIGISLQQKRNPQASPVAHPSALWVSSNLQGTHRVDHSKGRTSLCYPFSRSQTRHPFAQAELKVLETPFHSFQATVRKARPNSDLFLDRSSW